MAWYDNLEGPTRDAAAAIVSLFQSWGLGSLAPKIVEFVQQGYGADTITLLLQDTKEYKQRFKANEIRQQRGLPALSPAEYLATERAYRQALQQAGVPAGFYDTNEDFTNFLVADVSPSEIAERAARAREVVDTIDATQKAALTRYGIDTGALTAYYLDAQKALPILEKQVRVAMLDAERQRAGIGYSRERAERLFDLGVTVEQAREGYNLIQTQLPTLERLGEISGESYTLADIESEVFEGNADATNRRKRLASQERARYSGSRGTGAATLTRDRRFN